MITGAPLGLDDNKLLEELEERRHAALRIWATGTTPREVVFMRPGGMSSNPLPYVSGEWVVEQLNLLFWWNWDFEIVNQGILGDQIWVLGKLTVRDPENGRTIVKMQYGGSRMKSKTNTNIDIGDDLKTAGTDALKKAARWLGIAADVVSELEERAGNPNSAADGQVKAAYALGERAGMSASEVDDLSQERFG